MICIEKHITLGKDSRVYSIFGNFSRKYCIVGKFRDVTIFVEIGKTASILRKRIISRTGGRTPCMHILQEIRLNSLC